MIRDSLTMIRHSFAMIRHNRALLGVGVLLVGALTCLPATSQASFLLSGGVFLSPIPSNNDFKTQLEGLGFGGLWDGAQVSVDMDGQVSFYYHGAEASYVNSFQIASSPVKTENDESWSWPGEFLGSISVLNGDVLDVGFTSDTGAPSLNGAPGFGVFSLDAQGDAPGNDALGNTVLSPNMLVFGYGDHSGSGDGDFDDMMVSAHFTPVPEPASLTILGVGLGLSALRLRRRRRS
jgi:hypothetical protein